jgi:hypothetical protein
MAREFNDDTTERLPTFPETQEEHPHPIPIGPSLRQRVARLERLEEARQAPEDVTPESAAKRVLRGAGQGGKLIVLSSGVLGLLALAAKLWRPDLVGPIETLQQLFGQ